VQPNPHANWYADPTGRGEHRYWDGTAWSQWVATAGRSSLDAEPPGSDLPPPPLVPPPMPGPNLSAPAPGSGATSAAAVGPQGIRSLRGLTTALTWVVAVEVLALLAVVGAVVNRLVKLDALEQDPFSLSHYSDYRHADDAVGSAAGWMFVIAVAIAVLCMIYLFRASQNTERWATTRPTWAPGWTIGAWFIPLANLVLPLLVVREIWLRSTRALGGAGRVFAWWFTFVAGAALIILDTDPSSFDDVRVEEYLNLAGAVLLLVAALLFVWMVRDLTARQESLRAG
jgi:hypothetical protein